MRAERRHQFSRTWRRNRSYVIGASAASAILLGYHGFEDLAPERSVPSSLYRALQLFALGSGAIDGHVPMTLEIARFLAPLAAAGALITALTSVFRTEVSTQRTRLARHHTIVAGMSDAATLLARDARRSGRSVVLVAPVAQDARVISLQREGFPVLVGDPALPGELLRAGLSRADHLVALAETTAENAAIAAAVIQAQRSIGDANKRFRSFISIDDAALLVALQSSSEAVRLHLRQEFFSLTQRAAVATVDVLVAQRPQLGRLLIVGSGEEATAVAVEALRRTDDEHLHSVSIHADRARSAADLTRLLERETPALRTRSGRSRLERVRVQDVDEQLDAVRLRQLVTTDGAPDAAVLALTDPVQLLRWTIMWRDALGPTAPPVVTVTRDADGLTSLLGSGADEPGGSVISILAEGCVDDRIVSGRLERMARSIHEDYLRYVHAHETAEQRAGRPAARPWNELSPDFRLQNLDAAQAVWSALEATGHRVAPLHSPDAEDLEFDEQRLRRLVELEHGRWLITKGRAPVPWDQIADDDRRKTQAQVESFPRILADAGLEIVATDGH